jgi:hypothetical protein
LLLQHFGQIRNAQFAIATLSSTTGTHRRKEYHHVDSATSRINGWKSTALTQQLSLGQYLTEAAIVDQTNEH